MTRWSNKLHHGPVIKGNKSWLIAPQHHQHIKANRQRFQKKSVDFTEQECPYEMLGNSETRIFSRKN